MVRYIKSKWKIGWQKIPLNAKFRHVQSKHNCLQCILMKKVLLASFFSPAYVTNVQQVLLNDEKLCRN